MKAIVQGCMFFPPHSVIQLESTPKQCYYYSNSIVIILLRDDLVDNYDKVEQPPTTSDNTNLHILGILNFNFKTSVGLSSCKNS